MITIGSRKSVLMGAWILAALAILGINGTALLSLLDPTLIGHSGEVRTAGQKKRELDKIRTGGTGAGDADVDLGKVMVADPAPPAKAEATPEEAAALPLPAPAEATLPFETPAEVVVLPTLSGIVATRDIRGDSACFAVLDGRRVTAGDTVPGFVVRRVDGGGVILARGGREWTLPAPRAAFTVDRGE